jgi:predicted Zn finger-like uncharacterized protein
MILTCQKCSTSFNLDETLLKATGSKVRCSLCQNIWVAFPPETPDEGRLEPDEGGAGTGVAGLAATGAAMGVIAEGLSEDDAPEAESPETAPPELKFFADEEIEDTPAEDDDLVTDEINLDQLDQLLSEDESPVSRPAPDEDFKTEELNLADLEKMLDLETEQDGAEKQEDEPGDSEELDFGESLPDDADSAETVKEDSVIEELDLDLEDLENLLEEDTGLGDEIAAVEETASGIGQEAGEATQETAEPVAEEINLDMDSDLADLLDDDGREPVIEETEEIGVSEISDGPGADEKPPTDDVADDQDLDFELAPGLDGIFDEDEPDKVQDVPIEETEELDFSALETDLEQVDDESPDELQELELDLESESPEEAKDAADDFSGLDLSLEEDAAEQSLEKQPSDEEALPELDLSDLSQDLEEADTTAAGAAEEDEAPELDLEMDLEAAGNDEGDDLDLFLEDDEALSDSAQESQSTADIPEETRELEVDELESLLEGTEDAADAEDEPSSDSLELDLDLDSLEDSGGDDMDDATRELDLNDIEKILEMEGAEDDAGASSSEDLDLDLDMDSVAPPAEEVEETGEETTGADAALDLSELEKMLDVEDTTDSPAVADEDMDDLDLDFELQPSTEESDDLDLEFDMLDEEPAEASALFDTSESEDLGLDLEDSEGTEADVNAFETDLDFEIMDDDLAVEEVDLDLDAEDISADTLSESDSAPAAGKPGRPQDRDLTQELMDEMAAADTQTMASPPIESKPIKPAPPMKRKKKSSKSLVLLFILVLLGGAGYLLPKYTDIKLPAIKLPDLSGIPIIGEYFGSPSAQAILPVESTLKGDWVQNQQAGRLYTIQGRVKNEYDSPRSYIRVTGRVYADGRKFQRAAKAYCGNILSTEELATLPLADIQNKLSNRMGLDNSNVKVGPGQEVPFMVVFGDLPADVELQEFAVEISGSLPVTTK